MNLDDSARRWLVSALTIATLASCGPGTREPGQPAVSSAPFKSATAPDPSPPKGGVPVDALPSQVVSGGVASFKPASPDAGIQKTRDRVGLLLPSSTAAGKSAVYAPRGRAGRVGMRDAAGQDGEAVNPPPPVYDR